MVPVKIERRRGKGEKDSNADKKRVEVKGDASKDQAVRSLADAEAGFADGRDDVKGERTVDWGDRDGDEGDKQRSGPSELDAVTVVLVSGGGGGDVDRQLSVHRWLRLVPLGT